MRTLIIMAALICATNRAAAQAQTAEWVQGIAQAISTGVDMTKTLSNLSGSRTSAIKVKVLTYTYESWMTYTLGGQSYYHMWRVYRNLSGGYQYLHVFQANGQLMVNSSEVFEVGTSQGLPLTKRQWSCVQSGPELFYNARSTSQLSWRCWNTTTATSGWWPPSGALAISVKFSGPQMGSGCSSGSGTPMQGMALYNFSCAPDTYTDVSYKDTNLVVDNPPLGKVDNQ